MSNVLLIGRDQANKKIESIKLYKANKKKVTMSSVEYATLPNIFGDSCSTSTTYEKNINMMINNIKAT